MPRHRRIPRSRALAVLALAAGSLAAPASASALTVSAAASLRDAMPRIDASPTYNFAGSDALALQIRNGAPADVFLSANLSIPTQLFKDGLCSKPKVFATNVVVMVTPTANPAGIKSVYDLGRGERKRLAIGSATVPIGIYTRSVLGRLGLSRALRINTVSFRGQRHVGALEGLAPRPRTPASSTSRTGSRPRNDVKRFNLPKFAQPPVRYGMCIVKRDGVDTAAANTFMRKVLGPRRAASSCARSASASRS